MLSLYQLQIFVLVADARTVKAAAEQLHLTPPAVSSQIKSLEQTWRVELFDRRGHRMEPTPAARSFLPIARDLVQIGQLAELYLYRVRDGQRLAPDRWQTQVTAAGGTLEAAESRAAGQVVLGCGTVFPYQDLYRLVRVIQKMVPDLVLRIERGPASSILQRIRDGQVDLGFVAKRPRDRGLRSRRVLSDEVVLLVPPDHRWGERIGVSPAELAEERFVVQGQESDLPHLVGEALARQQISLHDLPVAVQVDTAHDAVAAVEQGLGIAFVSRTFARSASSKTKVVPIEGVRIGREILLVHQPEDRLSAAGRRLEAFLRAPLATKLLAGEG